MWIYRRRNKRNAIIYGIIKIRKYFLKEINQIFLENDYFQININLFIIINMYI